jgi:N-acetylglucosaminyldiphosphoundecaprenol N-acetyl-beta-D-mannosaminyltransferase
MPKHDESYILDEGLSQSKMYILGVRVDNVTKATALSTVQNFIIHRKENNSKKIFFTNVHTIHLARKSGKFKQVINKGDLVLPDGSGLKIAGRIFANPVKENLNGTDFTPIILHLAEINEWKVFLLGSKQNVVADCVNQIKRTYPQLSIAGFRSGFFTKDEIPEIINEINNSSPDILLVGMGSPMQELFISESSGKLNSVVCFAVGGLFDFLSGDKKRAPAMIRKIGMEWLFRFFNDPKEKWERIFIEIPVFLLLVSISRLVPNSLYSFFERRFIFR